MIGIDKCRCNFVSVKSVIGSLGLSTNYSPLFFRKRDFTMIFCWENNFPVPAERNVWHLMFLFGESISSWLCSSAPQCKAAYFTANCQTWAKNTPSALVVFGFHVDCEIPLSLVTACNHNW